MNRTRKGFTLVELLIVIVVIGILSAMMMMSSNEAVTTAKANNIAANLRSIKTAALAYYVDNMEYANTLTTINDDVRTAIFGYLDGKAKISDSDRKNYTFGVNAGRWYVDCDVSKAVGGVGVSDVKEKLAKRAKSNGLLNSENTSYNTNQTDKIRLYVR